MKAIIKTNLNTEGFYTKSDRTGKTAYPICINVNGKLFWYKKEEIKTVSVNGTAKTPDSFFKLLQIK